MMILGIDNGLDGGLVLVNEIGVHAWIVMPTINVRDGKRAYDANAIVSFILGTGKEWGKPDHIFLEKAQAMPGQGVTSMFSIGLGFGIMQGIASALYLPLTIVHPKTWQKEMFKDLPKTDTKAMSEIVCKRLWPTTDWRATEKCRKAHDGLCDAAMIAEYGRRQLAGGKV